MIRTLVYLAILFAIGAGFVWISDRPGELVLTWQGYEIRTSVLVAAIGLAVALALLVLVWRIILAVIRSPRMLGRFMEGRRRDHGLDALSRGMIAIGAGDLKSAKRSAAEARRLLSDTPLTRLLAAQAAQLAGDGAAARAIFEEMRGDPATEVLGLRGLFVEARRNGEHEAARHFVEEAYRLQPGLGWAGTALFEYQATAREWAAAMETLAANAKAGLVDRAEARRLRAVLLTGSALEAESGEPDKARAEALEAHRLAPDLVPAAVLAGRLLSRNGEIRRAVRTLERAWAQGPHPEIAETYAHVRPGDAPRDRLRRVRKLADLVPNHPEGALAVASAAIAAREFDTAKSILDGLGPLSERGSLMMADIAEESGDMGASREWLGRAVTARRDPAWIADGHVFAHWAPVSPISGRLDAFEWRVPTAPAEGELTGQIASARMAALPVRDEAEAPKDEAPEAGLPKEEPAAPPPAAPAAETPPEPEIAVPDAPATAPAPVPAELEVTAADAAIDAPVIPPVPDDPGPDGDDVPPPR